MEKGALPTSCTSGSLEYEITRADLPLHCPLSSMTLWNSHPRVFLPIEASGKERCPYCGTVYTLKDY